VTTSPDVDARNVTAEARPVQTRSSPSGPRRRVRGWGHLGLRTRLTLTFALGALVLSTVLAVVAFGLTRENLLAQREDSAVAQALSNAQRLAERLTPSALPQEAKEVLDSLPTPEGAQPVLLDQGEWSARDNAVFGRDDIPLELRDAVAAGRAARMRTVVAGQPYLVVGIPVAAREAQYFEGVSLIDVRATLDSLAISLLGAAALTTIAGGLLGFWGGRRVFTPLLEVGRAAEAIAGGRLDTRLPVGNDPDLDLIAASFNEMAQALESRLERDARFASEVSHELRSPLMTLSATVEVLENSRDDMPDRAQTALVLLSADVDRLQQLVEDLLEISRFDVGAIKLHLEEVVAVEIVIQAVSVLAGGGVPVRYEPEVSEVIVRVDKRRFGRVIANLLDNAGKYAGGATSVTLEVVDDQLRIAVADRGSGVPPEDRPIIFDRFSRGSESGNRSTDSGVGLGLALVDEHIRLHGGTVWVEDRLDGEPGARFVVELPIVDTPKTVDPGGAAS